MHDKISLTQYLCPLSNDKCKCKVHTEERAENSYIFPPSFSPKSTIRSLEFYQRCKLCGAYILHCESKKEISTMWGLEKTWLRHRESESWSISNSSPCWKVCSLMRSTNLLSKKPFVTQLRSYAGDHLLVPHCRVIRTFQTQESVPKSHFCLLSFPAFRFCQMCIASFGMLC